MKDKDLAKFKRLMKAGLERKQIIEKMGISPRTYYYLKNAHNKTDVVAK